MSQKTESTIQPIILWDVHEVLFTRNLTHWIYIFLRYPRKWEMIRSLDWHISTLVFRYFLHVTRIKKAELSSQELIDYARKNNKAALVELTVRIACDYTPITATIDIVKKLHALGYTQHIASNLGPTVFESFRVVYPEIFAHFGAIHMVHYHQDLLIKKPNPQFFVNYYTHHSLDPLNIIFIDDKAYNIKAAQSLGITGIIFKNKKQLIAALQQCDILLP
jgi:2-haloacid dehalogenase